MPDTADEVAVSVVAMIGSNHWVDQDRMLSQLQPIVTEPSVIWCWLQISFRLRRRACNASNLLLGTFTSLAVLEVWQTPLQWSPNIGSQRIQAAVPSFL